MITVPARARGALLSLTAFALFSVHDVIIKTLGGLYAPFQVIFFSALMGFPVLTLMLIGDAKPGTLRPKHPWWTALRTVAVTVTAVSAFYAFSTLPLAQVYAILFAAPLLITLLAIPMLGERVGWRRGVAVAIGLGGVLVVLQPGSTELTLGHAAGITAAVFGAFASVIVRRIGREERGAVLLVYPMLANIVVMGALMPLSYQPMPIGHLALVAVISALAFLATNVLIQAYRTTEAVIVAPMQYSQIIWAALFGFLLFGEQPGRTTLVGAAIIIASGVFIVWREDRGPRDSSRPVLKTKSRPEIGTHPRVGVLMRRDTDDPAP